MFVEKLRRRWAAQNTLLCVGLDPDLERFSDALRGQKEWRDEPAERRRQRNHGGFSREASSSIRSTNGRLASVDVSRSHSYRLANSCFSLA